MEKSLFLEQHPELAQFTLDKTAEIIIWVQSDGLIRYANPNFWRTLGYTKQAMLAQPLYCILEGVEPTSWQQRLDQLRSLGERRKHYPIKAADKQVYPVAAREYLINTEEGEWMGFFWKLRNSIEADKESGRAEDRKRRVVLTEIPLQSNPVGIISKDRKYRKVLKAVEQVADTQATVLIEGETGTGKELLANAIHHLSSRRTLPFIKVNCAAIPEHLAGSELFGHEKGAFTGAFQRKIGRFELANGGTLLLDEVGELPLHLQPKILRVLQEGEFERLGGNKTIKTDVRLIAATNRDLKKMIAEGTFREDLYFRLNVFPIYNIPLRERKDDIPLLVKFFIQKYNQKTGRKVTHVSSEDMEVLMKYNFPGNIRELENIIERAIILSKGEELNLTPFLVQQRS